MHEDGFVDQDVPGGKEKAHETGLGEDRLVPVSESIRYRKRAQAAEMKVEELERAYQEQAGQLGALQARMASIQLDQKLVEQLTAAKAVDLETAMIVVKDRLGTLDGDNNELCNGIEGAIDQVRGEKPFLFASGFEVRGDGEGGELSAEGRSELSSKTQGVKGVRSGSPNRMLQQAAEAAVQSGSRSDVQEYLRIRRSYR